MPLRPPSKSQDAFKRLVKIMSQLRSAQGCPWDRKQNHQSLKPYLIEEAYEVLEAIDSKKPQALQGELGDLLLQVVFHAQIASEKKHFDINGVIKALSDKLLSRHPHVYTPARGENAASRGAGAQARRWEEIKLLEKEHASRKSVVDGVPKAMPALSRAARVLSKASKIKFKLSPGAMTPAKNRRQKETRLGDRLLRLVKQAREEGLDPEHALHSSIRRILRVIVQAERRMRAAKKPSIRSKPGQVRK
jgi:tetrapyrrole methylase family protein/MazG family protein